MLIQRSEMIGSSISLVGMELEVWELVGEPENEFVARNFGHNGGGCDGAGLRIAADDRLVGKVHVERHGVNQGKVRGYGQRSQGTSHC